MSTQPEIQSNRREFITNTGVGLLAAGLGWTLKAEGASPENVQPDSQEDIQ